MIMMLSRTDDAAFCSHDTAELIAPTTAAGGGKGAVQQPGKRGRRPAQLSRRPALDSEEEEEEEEEVEVVLKGEKEEKEEEEEESNGDRSSSGSGDPMYAGARPRRPRDRCHAVYSSLLLAGIGFLLPYNSFITAVDYFLARYPGTTIVFDMSLTYIVVAFVAVFVNNALIESFSVHVRVTFGYIVAFLALGLVAIFEVALEVFSAGTSYVVILVAVAMVSLGCTVQQSSFYGYAGMLPRRFTQAVMTGESAAGLITSINRIVTKLLVPDAKLNTLTFFVLSAFMVLVCLLTHHLARRTRFVRHHVQACSSGSTRPADGADRPRVQGRYDQFTNEDDGSGIATTHCSTPAGTSDDDENPAPRPMHRAPSDGLVGGLRMRMEVAHTLWPYMLSIALAYFVTLCLFPGIESEVVSCALGDWMPVILMAIFNASDFCGKILGAIPYEWSPCRLVLAEVGRLTIVPLMVMCVAPRGWPVLAGRAWPMLLSALLGLSNGYFGSVPMIMAPAKVAESKKELAGNIMTLSYNVGLTTGSVTAYLLNYLLGDAPAVNCLVPVVANATLVPENVA